MSALPVENAFVAEQGRSGFPARASGKPGKRHCHSPGWRVASPIRTPRRLSFAPVLTLQQGSVCPDSRFVGDLKPFALAPSTKARGSSKSSRSQRRLHTPRSQIGSRPPRHSRVRNFRQPQRIRAHPPPFFGPSNRAHALWGIDLPPEHPLPDLDNIILAALPAEGLRQAAEKVRNFVTRRTKAHPIAHARKRSAAESRVQL